MNIGELVAKGGAFFLKKKLSAVQQVFDAAPAGEKAAFQASVSGDIRIRDIFGTYGVAFGHSIVYGAGASNAGTTAWVPLTSNNGNALVLTFAVNAGVAGETTAAMLLRIDAVIAAIPASKKATFVLLCLCNDADQLFPLATTSANFATLVSKIKAAGHGLIVILDPPRGSTISQAKKDAINKAVLEAYRQTRVNNIAIIDLYGLMSDASGNLAAAYNADETHFNDAGHRLTYNELQYLAANPNYRFIPRLAAPATGHAVSNPLLAGTIGANYPTNWARHAFSTVTPTVALAANDIGVGNKLSFTLDSTGGAVTYVINVGMAASTWAANDSLLVTYSSQITEITGTFDAMGAAGGSLLFYVLNGASVYKGVGPGRNKSVKRNCARVTAPAGAGLYIWISQPAGFVMQYSLSEVDILNETALGISLS